MLHTAIIAHYFPELILKNNKIMPEIKYSKEQFEGFTHRFIVQMKVDEDWRNDINVTIYSNSDSYLRLENFINEKKSDKVIAFTIEHRASKEQDEITSKLIDEMLKNI